MIKLEVWIDGIYSTAELIAEDGLFEKVWLQGDKSVTSITEPDELFEQIFEGLDSDRFEESDGFRLELDASQKERISKFLAKLRELEDFVNDNRLSDRPDKILCSSIWLEVKEAAKLLRQH
ncbi:hypothetical protein [Ferrimonas balearica]|uniref:hypothetical protein n=1 Tax=Ferrimonas balearica TaxID=44012 RepID=UPI00059D0DEF|nr:hypothetical protein [Ferrimonas balearica]